MKYKASFLQGCPKSCFQIYSSCLDSIEESEHNIGRELPECSIDDITLILLQLNLTYERFTFYKMVLQMYLDWCVAEKLSPGIALDGILYEDVSSPILYSKNLFGSIEDLYGCILEVYGTAICQDSNEMVLAFSLLMSWYGQQDVTAVRMTDIDSFEGKIFIPRLQHWVEPIPYAMNVFRAGYFCKGYSRRRPVKFDKSEYVFGGKPAQYFRQNNFRLSKEVDLLPITSPNAHRKLTPTRAFQSGLYYRIMQIEKERGIDLTGVSADCFLSIYIEAGGDDISNASAAVHKKEYGYWRAFLHKQK